MALTAGTEALASVRQRLGTLEGKRRRRNLEVLLERMTSELTVDVEGIMRPLAPDFSLHLHTPGGHVQVLRGASAVRTMFTRIGAGGRTTMRVDFEHLAVDDDVIIGSGQLTMELPSSQATAMGYAADAAAQMARVSYPMVMIIEFENGLMVGEHLYSDPATTTVTAL